MTTTNKRKQSAMNDTEENASVKKKQKVFKLNSMQKMKSKGKKRNTEEQSGNIGNNETMKKVSKLRKSNNEQPPTINNADGSITKTKKKKGQGTFVKPISKVKNQTEIGKGKSVKLFANNKTFSESGNAGEKPNWSDIRKKHKELRMKRKKTKGNLYEISHEAKKIWEIVRRDDCDAEKRKDLVRKLYDHLKSDLPKVVFAHDTARVVQWLLKLGEPEIRSSIIDQLVSHVPVMLKSKYAAFCVKRMLKFGSTSSKNAIINSLKNSIVSLMSHACAAPVLEYAFSNWATPAQKNQMREEFYGELYNISKKETGCNLSSVLQSTPDMKTSILSQTKANIVKVFNKSLAASNLFHCVVLDFLNNCSKEDQAEIFTLVWEDLLSLLKTKEGTRIAMMYFWHSSSKDRKAGVKLLKGQIKQIARLEHGHLVLLAIFDCIDDTLLLKKTVLTEITDCVLEISGDEHGRRVILYLVCHRDPLYFPASLLDILKLGDNNKVSKKPMEKREAELLEIVSKPFLTSIVEKTSGWMSGNSIAMVALAILKSCKDPLLESAFSSIAVFISDPDNKIEDGEEFHSVIEHSGTHMVLKKLIKHDQKTPTDQAKFSSILASNLSESIIEWWIKHNRGCFLLILLLESNVQTAIKRVKSLVSSKLFKEIKKQTTPGARILLQKLKD